MLQTVMFINTTDTSFSKTGEETAKWVHSEVESTKGKDKTHSMTMYHDAFMWDRG